MSRHLMSVIITIYDPGARVRADILDEDSDTLWFTPYRHRFWGVPHYDPLDCVRELENHERKLDFIESDYVFEKWAVSLDMAAVPHNTIGETMIGWELSEYGHESFSKFLPQIIELADPLVEAAYKSCDKHETGNVLLISMLIVWEYRTFVSGGYFEPEEWDREWKLIGRVTQRIEDMEVVNLETEVKE